MSNEPRSHIIGIHLEGIPGEDRSKTAGRVYYLDKGNVPNASSDYDWLPGLVSEPFSVETSINPFTGEWNVSSFTFELSNNNSIATYLLRTLQKPDDFLTIAMDESLTAFIPVSGTYSVNDAIFMGDETLRVTADLGSGLYTVERGAYGSTPEAHAAGTAITTHPSYWVPRLVTLVSQDVATGVETIRWRGYIDPPETSEDGARIILRTREAYTRWRSIKLNNNPVDLNTSRQLRRRSNRIVGNAANVEVTTRSSAGWIAVQTKNAVHAAQLTGSGTVLFQLFSEETAAGANPPRLDSVLELEDLGDGVFEQAWDEPVWEVLVWDRIGDEANPSRTISPLTGDDAFHPVRIARELLEQNELPDGWTADLGHIDFSAFDDAIAATPDLQIDQLILGVGGQPFSPFEVAEELLRAHGFIPSITDRGTYSAELFRTLNLGDVQQATNGGVSPYEDGPLHWKPAFSAGSAEISASVGAYLGKPGHKGVVRAVGGSKRAAILNERERVAFDMPFYRAARGPAILQELSNAAALLYYDLPRMRVRAADTLITGVAYDLGAFIPIDDLGTLETPWWVDRDGNRIEGPDLDGRTDAIGLLVARKLHTDNLTYTLTFVFMGYRTGGYARYRGPAAVVSSWSAPNITVANTFTDSDAGFFDGGDEVQLFSRDGVKKGNVATIDSIPSANVIKMSGAFGVTPAAGDILWLASSDVYFNDSRYPVTGRPYCHFADANEEIDHNSGVEQADEYSGGMGVTV